MRWTLPLLLALAPLAPVLAAAPENLSVTLLSGKNSNTASYSSKGDRGRLEALRHGDQPLLYVRRGDAAYVIRDPAVIAAAAAIMKPQQDLGARQGALGAEQGELGRQQGALGAQQARIAVGGARRSDSIAAQMHALGRQQAALGARQAALGKRQAALGEQQARLADLARPKEALVADALRRGLARRVD